jgi:hypothetical protein
MRGVGGRPKSTGPKKPKEKIVRLQSPGMAWKAGSQLTGTERKAFKMSPIIYRRYLIKVLAMPVNELVAACEVAEAQTTRSTMLQMVMLATRDTMRSGDIYKVDYFMSRLVGKITEAAMSEVENKFANLTLEELQTKYTDLIKENASTLKHFEESDWFKTRAQLALDVTPKSKEVIEVEPSPGPERDTDKTD